MSIPEGDICEGSDVDVVGVADLHEDFLDRIRLWTKLNDRRLHLEPMSYTTQEFEAIKATAMTLSGFGETILPTGYSTHSMLQLFRQRMDWHTWHPTEKR